MSLFGGKKGPPNVELIRGQRMDLCIALEKEILGSDASNSAKLRMSRLLNALIAKYAEERDAAARGAA